MSKERNISITILVLGLLDGALKLFFNTKTIDYSLIDGFINFSLYKNYGIAFDIPLPFFITFIITLVIILFLSRFIYKHYKNNNYASVAAIAVIIGSVSNLLDRIINGYTTDYLIIFSTSAINIADILIVTGIIGMLWYNKDTKF